MDLLHEVFASDPVSLATGELINSANDFTLPGVIPLAIVRVYRQSLAESSGFGHARTSSLDVTIRKSAENDDLIVRNETALRIHFDRPTPGPGLWERNEKHPHLGLAAGRNRMLLLKDGSFVSHFAKFPDGIWRPVRIEDRNGNALMLERSPEGVLLRVSQPNALSLIFTNDARGLRTGITLEGVNGETRTIATYAYDARGNMTEARVTYGPSQLYRYDSQDNLISWSDGAKTQGEHEYDAKRRVKVTRTNGPYNGDRFGYDPDERTTRFFPGGRDDRAKVFVFDKDKLLLSKKEPLGVETVNEYQDNKLAVTRDALGNETKFTYDGAGNLRSIADPEGRLTFFVHNSDGAMTMMMDAQANAWEQVYDEKGNLVQLINPEGYGVEIVNNIRGLPIGKMRSDGMMEQRQYDEHNWLIALSDFSGGVTRMKRDGFGRLTEVVNALGNATKFEYAEEAGNDFWTPSKITRPDGVVSEQRFDAGRSILTTRDGEGREITHSYGSFGLLEEITDAKGGRLRFSYDHEEQLVCVTNAKGLVWTFERDAVGRVIRECDFDGLEIHHSYDSASRLIESRHADGARIVYSYDRSGLLLQEDLWESGASEAKATTYAYDARGYLARAKNDWAEVKFQRDKMGRVVKETTNGRQITSRYDCCGNRVERVIDGQVVETLYDPSGGVKQVTIGAHAPLQFVRDAVGRELRRKSPLGFSLDQAFDPVGQLLKQTAGRMAASAGVTPPSPTPSGDVVERSYSWSKSFEPLRIIDRLWGETSYAYDRNGQVTETRFGDGGGERFSYDPALNIAGSGEAPARVFGKAEPRYENWLSSAGGRVKAARGPNGEKIFLQHDMRGRVVERRVECNGFRPKVWRYGWDGKDRLIRCDTPEGESWRYGYDPFGRRIFKRRDLNEDESRFFARKFPSLIERAAYEKLNYSVSYLNERPRAGLGSDASQDDGRPPIVGVSYFWDGDVVAEEAPRRLDGAVDWNASTRWHYEPETFRPVAKEEPSGENGRQSRLLYIVSDHLGTPREMFAESGAPVWAASYTTWGVVRGVRAAAAKAAGRGRNAMASSHLAGDLVQGSLALKPASREDAFDCPIRFQGQWEDEESGLYYNRFRYYDALGAFFVSPDPIGINGGARANAYVSNPIVLIDPFGLAAKPSTLGGCQELGEMARKIHNLAGSKRGISNSTVSIFEGTNGQLYASGSGAYLNPAQRTALKEMGVPEANIFWGKKFEAPSALDNHGETTLLRAMPEDVKIKRFGISWGGLQRNLCCVYCAEKVKPRLAE